MLHSKMLLNLDPRRLLRRLRLSSILCLLEDKILMSVSESIHSIHAYNQAKKIPIWPRKIYSCEGIKTTTTGAATWVVITTPNNKKYDFLYDYVYCKWFSYTFLSIYYTFIICHYYKFIIIMYLRFLCFYKIYPVMFW